MPAVTITFAKRKGKNAVVLSEEVLKKARNFRAHNFPASLQMTVTRNYGETAAEKSNELLLHMMIAVISVTILIWLVLGFRESGVVAVAIPVTLALTLVVFLLYGYTLNRITLFALIFSIGILVDDAIVVIENIVRHKRMPQNRNRSFAEVAVEAVDEVGNPTILATCTVIAAILPMAMVRGLMGPYMRPIPIGASAAMVFSLHGASVEATSQADAYGPHDWASIVCPTNRRPYGFDWEDTGRLDATEKVRHLNDGPGGGPGVHEEVPGRHREVDPLPNDKLHQSVRRAAPVGEPGGSAIISQAPVVVVAVEVGNAEHLHDACSPTFGCFFWQL
jgi:hypothetical protein